jgi:glutamine amidotransferase
MIGIIDYGMGNIHSVRKALEAAGAKTVVTNNAVVLGRCSKIVLPGVGAFRDAMAALRKNGLIAVINHSIKQGKYFLGICLGMQLIFDGSEEAPGCVGLSLIKGQVVRFTAKPGLKVPHMGWNSLEKTETRTGGQLLAGCRDKSFVYFCHSYYPKPQSGSVICATASHGKPFAAMVQQGSIFGLQFHPEKSQAVGLRIMRNFVRC